ncbi:MAG: flagellar assembly protein T N-terminal domain-containing protein [Thermodesulfobacteriota bacterium]
MENTTAPLGPSGSCRFMAVAIFLFACLLMAVPARARAAPGIKVVESTGVAVVAGGGEAAARDSAIADALRKAVEQGVGTLVSSETMVENYQALSDNVYTQTHGYIKSYSVTAEGQSSGVYRVSVRAEVAVGGLRDELGALGILRRKAENPRVLFMMAEKNIGHRYYVFWWWGRSEYRGESVDLSAAESSLKELFVDKGFNVVDISGSTGTFDLSDAVKVADLGRDGARSVGKGLNADIVVYGKAVATEGPRTPGSTVGTYLADVTATAVRVDDGVVLGTSTGHGAARNISSITGGSEAISKASAELGGRLVEQITKRWAGPRTVTLRLSGVDNYKELKDFKKRLKGRIRGIEAIFLRSYTGDTAVLELEATVSAQKIADGVSRLGPYFRVTGATKDSVDVIVEGVDLNR